jgi:hypothetical protein
VSIFEELIANWSKDSDVPDPHRHVDGIPWHEAVIPRRFHRCRAQTTGFVNYLTRIERCACGGLREGGRRFWIERNSRRKAGES